MASGNIKGITIEIGGDTTGLDKALRGVNSTIKDTQNELKQVDKALKLDPGNTELLEQKQRKLADAVQATSEKLNTLKDAQQQAQDQLERGEISQAQYDALTREIVKTEAALKDAKDAQDSFNVSIEKAKAKMEAVGDAAKAVQDKTKKLSGIGAGVVGALGGLALKSAASADELSTLSQQTGISTDELQKMQYASELVDVSVSDMTGAMAKMKKQMATSAGEEKFTALGIAFRDASGELRGADEVFYEALTALSQIENETERDLAAMDLFGKSADSLAGIIDDGGEALRAYGDEAANLGLIMDEETLGSLNAVNDELDKLKAQASAELAKTGAAALEALTPVLEIVIEKLSALFEWLGNLDGETMQTILTIAAIVAAISPVAGLISGIAGAINGVLALVPAITTAMETVQIATLGPIALIVAAVIALGVLIATHWDQIKAVLEAAWAKVKEVFEAIKDKIETFIEAAKQSFADIKANIEEVVDGVKEKFETLKENLSNTLNAIKEFFVSIWTEITDTINEKVNVIIGYVNSAIDGINQLTQAANNSALGKVLGLNIGTIGTIPELKTSGNAGRGGNTFTTNNYNTSGQPMQVNVNLDSRTMARALVKPMGQQMALAGSGNVR